MFAALLTLITSLLINKHKSLQPHCGSKVVPHADLALAFLLISTQLLTALMRNTGLAQQAWTSLASTSTETISNTSWGCVCTERGFVYQRNPGVCFINQLCCSTFMSDCVSVSFSGDSFTHFRFSEEKDWELDSFAASQVNFLRSLSAPSSLSPHTSSIKHNMLQSQKTDSPEDTTKLTRLHCLSCLRMLRVNTWQRYWLNFL